MCIDVTPYHTNVYVDFTCVFILTPKTPMGETKSIIFNCGLDGVF